MKRSCRDRLLRAHVVRAIARANLRANVPYTRKNGKGRRNAVIWNHWLVRARGPIRLYLKELR